MQSQKQFTAQINIDAYFFLLPPDAADDQGDETVKKKSKGKGTRLANVILASKKMTKKKTNSVSLFDGTDWMDEEMKDRWQTKKLFIEGNDIGIAWTFWN